MKHVLFDSVTGDLVARFDSRRVAAPPEAIEVSDEVYVRTMTETDGRWVLNEGGQVVKVPFAPPTSEQLAEAERAWRDEALNDVRWLRERHRDEQDMQRPTTLEAEQFSTLLAYLQLLRDWPQSVHFPDLAYRPIAPGWIAEQAQ